jgi:SAM-dependent methyltransferase
VKVEDEQTRLAAEKRQARAQWSQDPCGAKYGAKYEFATREFFDEVERHRYQEYAPWMPAVMGFDEFEGRRLLEVGCGMGTDLLQFARGGALCTGVDLTPRSVEISSLHFGLYDMRADFVLADGERLPFADESFDAVVAGELLEHVRDPRGLVDEARRVLRRGGTFIGSVPNAFRLKNRLRFLRGRKPEDDPTHLHMFSPDEVSALLEGFDEPRLHFIAGRLARLHPRLFANDIVFVGSKPR